jgi:cytidylate kinase
MGVNMLKVTISGHPGSGTSTLVEKLIAHYSWKSINGGQIFRDEAKNRNISLSEFGRLCKDDQMVDRDLDEQLKNILLGDEIEIVESRLAGWWAYQLDLKCIRIWLDVDNTERARRVANREGITQQIALEENTSRAKVDSERYIQMYGISPEQREPYTHVVDATHIDSSEVFSLVTEILEAKI